MFYRRTMDSLTESYDARTGVKAIKSRKYRGHRLMEGGGANCKKYRPSLITTDIAFHFERR